ncbi:hypothetical protein QYE76_009655 [Lolium multiflorum]|uniref:TF-B3 domain-containing protein n=1 Tax=Lolium multiflorum TaxID=4521 RepID=A0AAD8X152_LOLMU|nr:hypothetical protein QYE76_009655 [Lolium multiflorum]
MSGRAEADLAAVVVVVAAAELNARRRLPRRRLHRRGWTWSRACYSSSSSSSRATHGASRGSFAEHVAGDARARCTAGGFVRLLRWIVDVIDDARKMYLNIGWEKFARHHSLEAGFILPFSYFGDRDMSVKVFDETRCRRDYHGDITDEEDD